MPIYKFSGASPALRRAVDGRANMPGDIWHEGDVPDTVGLLRLGIRSEGSLDLRFANAGEYLNTRSGEVVSVRAANGENVLLVDVGNGAQSLHVLSGGVSATSAAQTAAQSVSETAVSVTGISAETQTQFMVPQDSSAGAQSIDSPELVSSQEDLAAYSAAISGGGYGNPYGALGASGAATYGTIADQTPVYEPPPDQGYYNPGYTPVYEPVYEPYYAPEPVYEPELIDYTTDPGYGPVNDGSFY